MRTNIEKYFKDYSINILLTIVIVIAILLRFNGLTYQSLWLDELCSLAVSMPSNSFSTMYEATVNDVHPPLYQSILWLLYHLFGFTEFVGRAFSAIVSSLAVLAIYLLGKELFNRETGLYAAIITATNEFLVFYAQETRSYSLLFLLSILSYLFFIKVLTNYTKKNFILYLLFTIALLYTHYFAFFLVATQVFVFAYFVIKEKDRRPLLIKLAILTTITLILALLPLVEYIVDHDNKTSFWIPKPSNLFFLEYIKAYIRNQYLESLFLLAISFSLIYMFQKTANNKFRAMIVVLLIWIIVGYSLPYIRSIVSIPLLSLRNTIIVIPALILLISYGIYTLKDKTFKIMMIGIIGIMSLYQLTNGYYYTAVKKQQWREVLVEVSKSRSNMPMFDLVYDGFAYKTYAKALNMDLDIADYTTLAKKITQGTMEECFFVLDSHGEHISKVSALNDPNIKKVLDIRKVMARGVLYAYKTTPEACLQAYNENKKKIDFNTCRFSKPYKGNPLLMQWTGSVFTPAYTMPKNDYNLIVKAKGTKAFEEYAKLQLEVYTLKENKKILLSERTFATQPDYANYVLPFSVTDDNNISFILSFINNKERLVPHEDRNIYLKSILVKTKSK